MASIEKRPSTTKNPPSYRVAWRDKGAKMSQTFPTLAEAEQWKIILEAAQHDTDKADRALLTKASTVPTFSDVAAWHMARLVNVQPYTLRKYRGYLANHLEELAPLPVDKITEDDLIGWIITMQKAGASPKTIRNVHGFIHSVMGTAVRRHLRHDNPCNGKLLPKRDEGVEHTTFLTVAEFEHVLSHAPSGRHDLYRLLFSTGLRLSEALALTPRDVVMDGAVPAVRVSKAWKQDAANGWAIGSTKTRRGKRTVALPPSTVAVMRHAVQGRGLDDLIFSDSDQPRPRQYQAAWRKAVQLAATDDPPLTKAPRLHDLRHSHASLMIAAGMTLFDLAHRLGHESITTTSEVYGHLVPDAHFKAAALAEKVLSVEV